MKKLLIIIAALLAAVICGIGAYCLIFNESVTEIFSTDKATEVNNASSDNDIVDYYAAAVNNTKSAKDFSVDITTNFEITNIDCSNVLMKTMINSFMGSSESEPEIKSYSFSDGVSTKNKEDTPLSVIQPCNSLIENIVYDGISSTSLAKTDSGKSVTVTLAAENIDMTDFMSGNSNESDYADIAPSHMQFVDIMTVMGSAGDMFSFGDESSEETAQSTTESTTQNAENGSDENGFDFASGEFTLEEMKISTDVNSDNLISSLEISAPVTMKADMEMMNKDITMTFQMQLTQKYSFHIKLNIINTVSKKTDLIFLVGFCFLRRVLLTENEL